MTDDAEVFDLAVWLHQQYEDVAADVGWETQEGTSVDFDDLPTKNRDAMIRLAFRLLDFGERNALVEVTSPGADADDDLPEGTVDMALYGNDMPGGGCVNHWPFWPHDIPQQGDVIELSDGEWRVTRRVFGPSNDTVRVYADPPPEAVGKS